MVSLRTALVLTLVVLGIPVAPLAQAQPAGKKVARVGILHPGSPPDPWFEGFRRGLHELGYVEGQNLLIEYRWAERRPERLPDLADQLVRLNLNVIVAMTGAAVQAARQRTQSVPIVMAVSGDPVGLGLVSSLARPGANITGLSFMSGDLAGKRLELLKEAFPKVSRVGVLFNPDEPPTTFEFRQTQVAAQALGLTLQRLEIQGPQDFERAFSDAVRDRTDSIITFAHAFAFFHRRRIIELAAKYNLPAMYGWREFVEEGGLLAYGPWVPDLLRRAAVYVDRILKGAKPADLPIEQPTKFELIINLKTSKALGLTIPPSLLLRADQVIQ